MSGISADDRVVAVQRLGYTKREAAFLVLAALHGGFFLRRQFCAFIGTGPGLAVNDFSTKLRTFGDARVTPLGRSVLLHHVTSRRLYRMLGVPDRDRFHRSSPAIRERLLGLDYILAHREYQFLATEGERVDYFTSQRAVDLAHLPQKLHRHPGAPTITTRYFEDRSPIALAPSASSATPVVVFTFVDAGAQSMRRFEAYLRRYQSVITLAKAARVVYVAEDDGNSQTARRAFEQLWSEWDSIGSSGGAQVASLLRYFRIRARYDAGSFDELTIADVQELPVGRAMFGGSHFEALFERWKQEGDGVVAAAQCEVVTEKGGISFSTWCPEPRPDVFGTAWRASRRERQPGGPGCSSA